ncbi:hypothetical protein [Bosea sp. Leaf344]|uniref:hypothetical protein n=1 Tax=Bosea sp. Leaf344 TaxID=1736346 RepID=UPI000AFA8F4C|nr:hypothetical protein [Bosea sp. Leaf344]
MRALLHVKSAPERVLEMCADQWRPDGAGPLDTEHWRHTADEIAAQGERVLALTCRRADPGPIMPGACLHRDRLAQRWGMLGSALPMHRGLRWIRVWRSAA